MISNKQERDDLIKASAELIRLREAMMTGDWDEYICCSGVDSLESVEKAIDWLFHIVFGKEHFD